MKLNYLSVPFAGNTCCLLLAKAKTGSKYFFIVLCALLFSQSGYTQAPPAINYQAVARNGAGAVLENQLIRVRLSIHDISFGGNILYQETDTATTNKFGLFALEVGRGNVTLGTFASITWGNSSKFLQMEYDPTGGTTFINLNTSELISVPYALYANKAGVLTGTVNMGGDLTGTNAAANVTKLQGEHVSSIAPATGEVLTWNSDSSYWMPSAIPVAASGTVNYVSKFVTASSVGDSKIYDNGINVGVGTPTPQARLHVSGSNTISAHLGGSSFNHQAFIAQCDTTATPYTSSAIVGFAMNSSVENHGLHGFAAGTDASSYNVGVFATAIPAVQSTGRSYGVYADAEKGSTNYGIYGSASGTGANYAGYFSGNVYVGGTLSKGSGTFKIDHPLDPENKYLYHSFVESPDMMNIYNGNVTTDANGEAIITMPAYFEALNKDFRYQLTTIGSFARAMVEDEIKGNVFTIKTDVPNVKISWQVTGVRHDKFAEAHPVVPEVEKEEQFKGYYLHPAEWGKPATQSIDLLTRPKFDEKPTTK